MKKIILLSCMAGAFLLSSCSYDETVESYKGNGISFRTFTDNVTRSTAINDASGLTDFKVAAYKDADKSLYFKDTWTKATDAGTNSWNCSNIYYWPGDNSAQLNFSAYGPVANINGGTEAFTGTSNKITGISPAVNAKDQTELLVAYNTGTGANNQSGVNMQFKHIFSQIVVQARNKSNVHRIEVKGVKLGHLHSTADLTMPSASTDNNTLLQRTGTWDNYVPAATGGTWDDGKNSYVSKALADNTEMGADYTSLMGTDNSFIVIPQSMTAWTENATNDGAYISVLCRIWQKTGNGADEILLYPSDETQWGWAAVGIAPDWNPGYKYTYNLSFFDGENGGAGTVDPDPTDPDPTDPTVPIDPNPNPGDPVVGGAIKINVTVDTWEDATPQPGDIVMK